MAPILYISDFQNGGYSDLAFTDWEGTFRQEEKTDSINGVGW